MKQILNKCKQKELSLAHQRRYMLGKDVLRQLKLTLCLREKNQECEGKVGLACETAEGNACGMNEIRIPIQGELVVLYQESV